MAGTAGIILAASHAAMFLSKAEARQFMDEHKHEHERATVLVVDDDPVIRAAVQAWLKDHGYTVREAADGIEALYILDHASSAIVLVTDYAMPRLDGRALMEFVTNSPDLAKRTAIIYMTADDRIFSPVFAGELMAQGTPVLGKPFDLDALTRAVAEARLRTSVPASIPA